MSLGASVPTNVFYFNAVLAAGLPWTTALALMVEMLLEQVGYGGMGGNGKIMGKSWKIMGNSMLDMGNDGKLMGKYGEITGNHRKMKDFHVFLVETYVEELDS